MNTQLVSTLASQIVDTKDIKSLETFLSNCSFYHCEHVPYTVTVSHIDRVRSLFLSRITSAMPHLTKLVIECEVTSDVLSLCIADKSYLSKVIVPRNTEIDAAMARITQPPRLARIDFSDARSVSQASS